MAYPFNMSTCVDPNILVVEDDDGHAELIRDGLEEAGICNDVIRFENGLEAWEYLDAAYRNSGNKPNFLVLLDINMPVMNGIELLERVKSHAHLSSVPVIMLTTTDDPKEVAECYRIGCNFYINKPVDFVQFAEILRRLGLFIQVIKV